MVAENVKLYFGAADISVFAVVLSLSAAIGIYYAVKDRKKKMLSNYYFGGKNMSPVPLGLSIAVTFISAMTVMGYPTESYVYGFVSMWYAFTLVVPVFIAYHYYIPLVHRLQLATIYQFIELRFHSRIRKLSSGMEICNQTMYMGCTIYLPALALNAVTPLQLSWTIALTGGICTFYTVLGGMKAVVWTDTFQAIIMFAGTLAALIRAMIFVGGADNVWEAAKRGGRDNVWDFNPDPRLRSTFWTIMVGLSCTQSVLACSNQSICQRYLSCGTVKAARLAAVVSIFPKLILTFITMYSGLVAYAYFEGCDPLLSGEITKKDQLIPYLVLKIFRDMPGMAGLYVAAAYSGTLSTVSSGINSLSAMVLEDFMLPFKPHMTSTRKLTVSKFIALSVGTLVTSVAYSVSVLDETVVSLVLVFRGACGVPILAVLTLGIFWPWCNTKGALIGQLVGTGVTLWLALGGFIYGKSPETLRKLPTSIDQCLADVFEMRNFTNPANFSTTASWVEEPATLAPGSYPAVYALSFAYYSCVAMLTTVAVGLIVSFITGANDPCKSDPKLFMPIIDNRFLSREIRSFFRFGVPELKPLSIEDEEKDKDETAFLGMTVTS